MRFWLAGRLSYLGNILPLIYFALDGSTVVGRCLARLVILMFCETGDPISDLRQWSLKLNMIG